MKRLSFLSVLLLFAFMFLLAPGQKVSAKVPLAGEILDAGDMQVEVLWRSEGNRTVYIYKYNDVDTDVLTLPDTISAGGYEWKVIGILSKAFEECTTPTTIILNPSINFYYVCPDAFINGSAQTIEYYPADGEWNTLSLALEYMGPTPKFLPDKVPNNAYAEYKTVTNIEDTLYVTVPKGTYTLPEQGYELRVYSNTTLDLNGVTFKRNTSEKGLKCHMLSLGTTGKTMADGSVNAKGYDGGSNITIIGGTFDNGTTAGANNICRMSHLSNVTIQDAVFKYLPKTPLVNGQTNAHCIEMAGCKKVVIKNCKFYNNANCFANNEAVQIESCSNDPTAQAHTNIAAPLDNTQTSSVTITKCRFEGFNYGCGSNHLGPDDCYKTMKFTYNTFVGCHKYCVCLYNYKSVTVSKNKLKDCGELILNPSDHKSTKITKKSNKRVD